MGLQDSGMLQLQWNLGSIKLFLEASSVNTLSLVQLISRYNDQVEERASLNVTRNQGSRLFPNQPTRRDHFFSSVVYFLKKWISASLWRWGMEFWTLMRTYVFSSNIYNFCILKIDSENVWFPESKSGPHLLTSSRKKNEHFGFVGGNEEGIKEMEKKPPLNVDPLPLGIVYPITRRKLTRSFTFSFLSFWQFPLLSIAEPGWNFNYNSLCFRAAFGYWWGPLGRQEGVAESSQVWRLMTAGQNLTPSHSYVIWSSLQNLSEPQFPAWQSRFNTFRCQVFNTYFIELLW